MRTGTRNAVVLLPLVIGVAVSSLVAVATFSWSRAFIAWELLWWLFVSIILGVITYRLARMVDLDDEDLSFPGCLGGLLAFLIGISTLIIIMINGHLASAPFPLYWPLPISACLLAAGGQALDELHKNVQSLNRVRTLRAKREEEVKKIPPSRRREYENQFLWALYVTTAGDTTRFVRLDSVWSGLNYEFSHEMTPHALTVWHERECINIRSPSDALSGLERLSLT